MAPKRARTGPSHSIPRQSRPHYINEYGIEFVDESQRKRYDTLSRRGMLSTRYLDEDCLNRLGLSNDIHYLLNRIGWNTFITLQHPAYARTTLEFFSSINVVLFRGPDVDQGRINFRLFNHSFSLTLIEFNALFKLPPEGDRSVPSTFIAQHFWNSISIEGQYNASSSKASFICNPTFRYLQRFMAHTIFGRAESDGVANLRELYFLYAMVQNIKVDSGAFMAQQMARVGSAASGKVITGGLVTSIAIGLGFEANLLGLQPIVGNGRIDLESCLHMKLIVKKNADYWLYLRGHTIFRLPNPTKTAVSNKSNWVYSLEGGREDDEIPQERDIFPPDIFSTVPPPPPPHFTDRAGTSSTPSDDQDSILSRLSRMEAEQLSQRATLHAMQDSIQSMQEMMQALYTLHFSQNQPPPPPHD